MWYSVSAWNGVSSEMGSASRGCTRCMGAACGRLATRPATGAAAGSASVSRPRPSRMSRAMRASASSRPRLHSTQSGCIARPASKDAFACLGISSPRSAKPFRACALRKTGATASASRSRLKRASASLWHCRASQSASSYRPRFRYAAARLLWHTCRSLCVRWLSSILRNSLANAPTHRRSSPARKNATASALSSATERRLNVGSDANISSRARISTRRVRVLRRDSPLSVELFEKVSKVPKGSGPSDASRERVCPSDASAAAEADALGASAPPGAFSSAFSSASR